MVTLVNRVKVATTTTGTGAVDFGSVESGYQSPSDAGLLGGETVRYVIEDGDAWEIGSGGINGSVTQMSRTLLESSTGSKLSLSGDAVVFITAASEDIQQPPSEGSFVDGDKTKLDGIEAGADVTDAANVTAAGALMDSEVANLAAVKAFDPTDYATAAQGSLADTATQPGDNISTLINDAGYTTNVGDITAVTAGNGLSGGGTSGSVTLSVDLSELTDMTATMVGTDEFIVLDAGADRRKAASEIGLSIFNNDAGFSTTDGTVTSVAASGGTGISVSGSPITTSGTFTITNTAPDQTVVLTEGSNVTITGTYPNFTISAVDTNTTYSPGTALDLSGTTFNVDLSELSTSASDGDGDFFVVVDSLNAQRKLTKSNINISGFNNDAGYTTNVGDITGVTAGSGITGGGTSGTVTISHADTSSQASVNNSGVTFIQDVSLDTYGHVTSLGSATVTLAGLGYTGATNADNYSSWSARDADGTTYTVTSGDILQFAEGTGIDVNFTADDVLTITNTAPDQTVVLTGGTNVTVTGTYPNFTIASTDTNTTYSPGDLLDLSGTTFNVDLSELTDMTATMVGADEFIVLDAGLQRRKAASEIGLSVFNNDSGFTTNAGTVTSVAASGGTGISVSGSPITASGTLTITNTAPDQTVVLTEGSNVTITGTYPNFTIASTDTNTTYSAGTALDLSGTTFNVDLSELSTSTSDGDGDFFVVVDSVNAQRKLTKSSINVSGFNNDAGYTTNVGDITGVTAGTGLSGGGTSGSVTLDLDLSELTDMTSSMVGTDEFIVLDAGSDKRKAANEIGLSIFNNDAGFTTSGGATVFIASADASNSATIDFTGFDSSSYDGYMFLLQNIEPAFGTPDFYMRTSSNGGSTYDTTGAYAHNSRKFYDTSDSIFSVRAATFSAIVLASDVGAYTSSRGLSGQVWMSDPSAVQYTKVNFQNGFEDGFGRLSYQFGSGARKSTTEVNAVRFLFGSGNIFSGTITMYGLKNS